MDILVAKPHQWQDHGLDPRSPLPIYSTQILWYMVLWKYPGALVLLSFHNLILTNLYLHLFCILYPTSNGRETLYKS